VIVECPACHTRYRTDSTTIVDEDTFFECSQESCQHVFQYTPPVLRGGENEARPTNSPSSTALLEEHPGPIQPHDPSHELPAASSTSGPTHTIESPPSLQFDDPESFSPPEEPFSAGPFFDKEFDEPEQFSSPEAPFFADEEESNDEQISFSRPTPKPQVTDLVSLRSFLTFLGCLFLGYTILAFYCLRHIEDTEVTLGRLPLLGSLFTDERFSARHIALIELKGDFWTTKDSRRVFAISGKAVNTAFLPARSVQVEGAVYDANGKLVGQRVIFCGTETTATALESLTVREIGILQNLVPPKQFNVPAGQSVNFLIVFTSPPPTVAEFSSRVVAAQFGAP
jgi:hypothetical protein